ncbi:glycine cleavage system protein P-like pyridoxal-binding family, partial [Actinomadura rupiterrae]|nr:glycine cleavage system protein P-like pyridoxal-binding family [Actinomadura rupiterrae]
TAQVLLAVMASMYAVYHGPEGLAAIAQRAHGHALRLAAGLRAGGVEVVHEHFFDTVFVNVPGRAAQIVAAAREQGVNLRLADADHVGIACDETTTDEHVAAVWRAFGVEGVEEGPAGDALDAVRRETPYLTHPVFHAHRSETAMLRYLRRLQDKDIALDGR